MVLIQCRDTRSGEPQVRCECYVDCAAFKEILGDPEGGDQRSRDGAEPRASESSSWSVSKRVPSLLSP